MAEMVQFKRPDEKSCQGCLATPAMNAASNGVSVPVSRFNRRRKDRLPS